jgi:hypothetical protein
MKSWRCTVLMIGEEESIESEELLEHTNEQGHGHFANCNKRIYHLKDILSACGSEKEIL